MVSFQSLDKITRVNILNASKAVRAEIRSRTQSQQ